MDLVLLQTTKARHDFLGSDTAHHVPDARQCLARERRGRPHRLSRPVKS